MNHPPTPSSSSRPLRHALITLLALPQTIPLLLLILAFFLGARLSPYFLDLHFLLDSTSLYMETGIMALAMTFIIISGHIDLSVASNLALTAVLAATLHTHFHLPMPLILPLALLIASALGLFNGLLIACLGLPSLTVTLGTLALYRGLAQVLAGDHSISGFPAWFLGIDYLQLAGLFPAPLLIFLFLALLAALLLHRTTFGRMVYALGTNESAARFSGIPVHRVKLIVFTLSGLSAGIGALLMLSRLSVARYDLALGQELAVITAVVLGGTDIFGGRGSIIGTVIALFLLGLIHRGMGVANITAENQLAVTGTLLILAVFLSRISAWFAQHLTPPSGGSSDDR